MHGATIMSSPGDKKSSVGILGQTVLLTSKNLVLQKRSIVATSTQLLIGLLFLSLIQVMQFSLENSGAFSQFLQNLAPSEETVPKPAECIVAEDSPTGFCYTFLYAPKDSSTSESQRLT
jgi:predicted aspartyl protease